MTEKTDLILARLDDVARRLAEHERQMELIAAQISHLQSDAQIALTTLNRLRLFLENRLP